MKCPTCNNEAIKMEDTRDKAQYWICHECEKTLGKVCEVYSRVCGYLRPVSQWNKGKRQEFQERVNFKT